jgi:hypothetical protein
MTMEDFQLAIATVNPEAEGHFSPREHKPWVVLCGEPYEFASPEAAIGRLGSCTRWSSSLQLHCTPNVLTALAVIHRQHNLAL